MNPIARQALGAFRFVVSAVRPPIFTAKELAVPPVLPEGFLWGTATAAHQIEGENRHNDWWAFEQEHGLVSSGRATDSWNRVNQDIGLMGRLRANAYRFSIEWSRVEPERGGPWDESAWAHYVKEVGDLCATGIKPMVTLHHFTLPTWLNNGLLDPEFPLLLGRFAGEAARRMPEVELWCTINEPNVLVNDGFIEGKWPPGLKSEESATQAFEALLRGHAAASIAVRRVLPGAKIGVAMHLRLFEPGRRWLPLDWVAAGMLQDVFNWSFYDSILSGRIRFCAPGFPSLNKPHAPLLRSADWFGLNYYTREMIEFSPQAPSMAARSAGPGPLSDTDEEIYPEGLLRLLCAAHERYGLPIYVTENGIADKKGIFRPDFIRAHVHALARAIERGVPVLGYFHWSLLDNFEWEKGFAPRYGLYRVDYARNLARTPAAGSETFTALAPPTVKSRGARTSSRSRRCPWGQIFPSSLGTRAASGSSSSGMPPPSDHPPAEAPSPSDS
jgi:beta-glucosidase